MRTAVGLRWRLQTWCWKDRVAFWTGTDTFSSLSIRINCRQERVLLQTPSHRVWDADGLLRTQSYLFSHGKKDRIGK